VLEYSFEVSLGQTYQKKEQQVTIFSPGLFYGGVVSFSFLGACALKGF